MQSKTWSLFTYRDALAASSADGVISAFTNDGVVMGPGSPTASGLAKLKSTYDGIFGAVGLDLNFKIDEIIVGKEYGFVRSTSAGTLTVKANGATAPEENKLLQEFRTSVRLQRMRTSWL